VLIDVRIAKEIKQPGTIGIYQYIDTPRGLIWFRIADPARTKDTPIIQAAWIWVLSMERWRKWSQRGMVARGDLISDPFLRRKLWLI